MDIHLEKIELVKLLLNTDNPSVIQSIKDILKKDKASDFWESLFLDQQNEIKEASIQIKIGETVDYDSFMSKHRQ